MTSIIAERLLHGTSSNAQLKVLVRLWAPAEEGEADWSCKFTFEMQNEAPLLKDGSGRGVDSIQALLSGIYGVSHTLDKSEIEWSMFSAEELATEERPVIDDGFPRSSLNPMFIGTAFRKQMEELVEGRTIEALHASRQTT